jgi:hypothetical protein
MSTPTITPTFTSTTNPTETFIPTVTLTPSPIATNTPTDQELLEALDNRSRDLFHAPASEFIDFFLEIQESLKTDNRERFASLVYYPITIHSFDGKDDLEIQNAAEFVANYEKIVTPEWKEIVLTEKPSGLSISWRGVMVSRGELWFGDVCLDKSCQNTKYYIYGINHTDW